MSMWLACMWWLWRITFLFALQDGAFVYEKRKHWNSVLSLQKEGKSLLQVICLLSCMCAYRASVVNLWAGFSSQSTICLCFTVVWFESQVLIYSYWPKFLLRLSEWHGHALLLSWTSLEEYLYQSCSLLHRQGFVPKLHHIFLASNWELMFMICLPAVTA